jgi:thymidylate synthase
MTQVWSTKWPTEQNSQLSIGNIESPIAICSLWTPRDYVASKLSSHQYSVIGQLYSAAGIEYIIANILSHPFISNLIVTGKSLNNSELELLRFFAGVTHPFLLDRFPEYALNELRSSVQLHQHGLRDLQYKLSRLPQTAIKVRKPQVYVPKPTRTIPIFPSEQSGYTIRSNSISDATNQALALISRFGNITNTRYGSKQREILNLTTVLYPPFTSNFPEHIDKRTIQTYIKHLTSSILPESITLESSPSSAPSDSYTYGHLIGSYFGIDQIQTCIDQLNADTNTRSAYISLWDPTSHSKSPNPPCITLIQIFIRNNLLHLTAYIRSNDIYRAYPINLLGFIELQSVFLSKLNYVRAGTITIHSASAHVYEENWQALTKVPYDPTTHIQKRFTKDPRSSIVFRYEPTFANSPFFADIYSPESFLLTTLSSSSTDNLALQLEPFISRVDHALYIGRELNRLSQLKSNYIQDRV